MMLGPSGMKLRPLPPLSSLLQVLGLDVMLDDAAAPRLLEINSNPSLAVDMEARETGGRADGESERARERERAANVLPPRRRRRAPPSRLPFRQAPDPDRPGRTLKAPSPVDVAVKQRVLSDMLVLVAAPRGAAAASSSSSSGLRAVVGAPGCPAPPPRLALLDRCRRLCASPRAPPPPLPLSAPVGG